MTAREQGMTMVEVEEVTYYSTKEKEPRHAIGSLTVNGMIADPVVNEGNITKRKKKIVWRRETFHDKMTQRNISLHKLLLDPACEIPFSSLVYVNAMTMMMMMAMM